ncbi:MAG: DUF5663 domain-containing protein [bacterium]|nr:DUF5663 domain-containing protein [bacterium]
MFKLDNNLLIELGLGGLPSLEKNRLLAQIYETLEMRVGIKLAEGMSDQQLDEFETLMPLPTDTPEAQKEKEGQAHNWLETNFPNYKQVVAEELAKLKEEVKAAAPQIMASVQANPAAMPAQPAMPGQVASVPGSTPDQNAQQPAQPEPAQQMNQNMPEPTGQMQDIGLNGPAPTNPDQPPVIDQQPPTAA